jgi:hypothetical protein
VRQSPLPSTEHLARQDTRQRLFHQGLEFTPSQFDGCRDSGCKVDQFVVQQWHATFERGGHRHLVGEHQEIVGQLGLRIDREHDRKRVLALRSFEEFLKSVSCRMGVGPEMSAAASATGNTPTYDR